MQPLSRRGRGLAIGNDFAKGARQAVATANDTEADLFFDAARSLHQKIFVQHIQDRAHFAGGPLPVGRREGKKSESVHAESRGCFDDAAGGGCAGTVSYAAGKTLRGGPTPVA